MTQIKSNPLVSILMPAFNAEKTILYAISSILVQTYENWECIVVDDGSSDSTCTMINLVKDDRIKLFRLSENFGRGIARQHCLSHAKGCYITMLDADDWIYPTKLQKQVSFLESNPDVSLYSCAMSIVNKDKELIALRKLETTTLQNYNVLKKLICPHAPSMIRSSVIQETKYDSSYVLAQDVDFLRRVLLGRKYIVTTEVLYSYSEINSVSLSKIIWGHLYNSLGYLKFIWVSPIRSIYLAIGEIFKIPIKYISNFIYGESKAILRRSKNVASNLEIAEHELALKKIDATYKKYVSINE